jgi:hypothetical protein
MNYYYKIPVTVHGWERGKGQKFNGFKVQGFLLKVKVSG